MRSWTMKRLKTILSVILVSLGVVTFAAIALAFTSLPFWAHYNLSITESTITDEPRKLIILSGGGMPSGDGMMKAYYAAKLMKEFPEMSITIAMPNDTLDSAGIKNFQIYAFALASFGIDTTNLHWLQEGHNTRTQALAAASTKSKPTIILTEPVHTHRAVLAFRKVGFSQIRGMGTHETSLGAPELSSKTAEEYQVENLDFRYNVWNYLKYEITVLREYTTIAYYWMRGWV